MKTILFENWKTSLLGLILVCAGTYSGFTNKQSWTESGPIILSGIGLICSRDAKKSPAEILSSNLVNHDSHD
jgi:hypothetical protein